MAGVEGGGTMMLTSIGSDGGRVVGLRGARLTSSSVMAPAGQTSWPRRPAACPPRHPHGWTPRPARTGRGADCDRPATPRSPPATTEPPRPARLRYPQLAGEEPPRPQPAARPCPVLVAAVLRCCLSQSTPLNHGYPSSPAAQAVLGRAQMRERIQAPGALSPSPWRPAKAAGQTAALTPGPRRPAGRQPAGAKAAASAHPSPRLLPVAGVVVVGVPRSAGAGLAAC
eukprot:scaffold559612_cov36-Prasinocladus_malaysianus.AAC.1